MTYDEFCRRVQYEHPGIVFKFYTEDEIYWGESTTPKLLVGYYPLTGEYGYAYRSGDNIVLEYGVNNSHQSNPYN